MYYDQILIGDDILPDIPDYLTDFFREPEESFHQLFLFVYTYADNEYAAYQSLDDALKDVDWADHDLVGDGLTYKKAVTELSHIFRSFAIKADRQIPFLRKPPEGIMIADVRVMRFDKSTFKLMLEFCEGNGGNSMPLMDTIHNHNRREHFGEPPQSSHLTHSRVTGSI